MNYIDPFTDLELGLILLTPEMNIKWFNKKAGQLFCTDQDEKIKRILFSNSNKELIQEKVIFLIKLYAVSEDIICYPVDADKEYTLLLLINKSSLRALINSSQIDLEDRKDQSNLPYTYSPGNMVPSNSPLVKKMIDNCLKVANHDTTILITGESGVGKEVVARLIHRAGNRMNGELLCVNCACIPENLLEAELFGYEDGAFTGAKKGGKIGLFQVAHGGTVFLDEIGELPTALQVKLLRVIQEKQMYRIGGSTPISINVRIIAATNKNLRLQVKKGLFREDLYYRLNVIPIMIPPLRERPEDISPLSKYFIDKYNQEMGFQKTLTQQAISLLEQYSWPGNIRQLENFIQRVIIFIDNDVIDSKHVEAVMEEEYNELETEEDRDAQLSSLQSILENTEKKALLTAKEKYLTTREMANHLGISQPSVVRKLKKYKL